MEYSFTDKPENDVMAPWSEFMSDSELEPKKSEYLFLCDEPENDVMALWSEFVDDGDDEDVLDQKIAEAFSGMSEQWGASPEWIHDWKNYDSLLKALVAFFNLRSRSGVSFTLAGGITSFFGGLGCRFVPVLFNISGNSTRNVKI